MKVGCDGGGEEVLTNKTFKDGRLTVNWGYLPLWKL